MRRLGSAVTLSSNRYLVSAAARSTLWFHNPERPRGLIRTLRVKFDVQSVAFLAPDQRGASEPNIFTPQTGSLRWCRRAIHHQGLERATEMPRTSCGHLPETAQ